VLVGKRIEARVVLAVAVVVGDAPAGDRVEPGPELADRLLVERCLQRALHGPGRDLAHVPVGHLQRHPPLDVLQVPEHEDAEGEGHGIAASGRAGGADVVDELFIRKVGEFKL